MHVVLPLIVYEPFELATAMVGLGRERRCGACLATWMRMFQYTHYILQHRITRSTREFTIISISLLKLTREEGDSKHKHQALSCDSSSDPGRGRWRHLPMLVDSMLRKRRAAREKEEALVLSRDRLGKGRLWARARALRQGKETEALCAYFTYCVIAKAGRTSNSVIVAIPSGLSPIAEES